MPSIRSTASRAAKSLVIRGKRLRYGPKIEVSPHPGLTFLGSRYGGWHFIEEPGLPGSTIISCGLGEDASFDVEFAARYNARVLLVDPTPRAVAHYRMIEVRLGEGRTTTYSPDGRLAPESYDLSRLS